MKTKTKTMKNPTSPSRHWSGQIVLCALVAVASILVWEAFIDSPDQARAEKKSLATSEALSSTTLQQDIIKAQKETSAKIEELTKLFKTGKAKVEIVTTDEPKPAPSVTPKVRR